MKKIPQLQNLQFQNVYINLKKQIYLHLNI